MMDVGDFRVELDNLDFPMNISGDLDFDMDSNGIPVPMSYKELSDKPKLNGKTIDGNVNESDPTVPAWAKQPEKPKYTVSEIGMAELDAGDFEEMWESI